MIGWCTMYYYEPKWDEKTLDCYLQTQGHTVGFKSLKKKRKEKCLGRISSELPSLLWLTFAGWYLIIRQHATQEMFVIVFKVKVTEGSDLYQKNRILKTLFIPLQEITVSIRALKKHTKPLTRFIYSDYLSQLFLNILLLGTVGVLIGVL